MGCDIHIYVERKVNDQWIMVPEEEGVQHPYYEGSSREDLKEYFNKKTWGAGRNYLLFGLLAGVRYHNIETLIPPRGTPKDLSEKVKMEWKDGIGDWHHPSWYSLLELLDFREKSCNRIFELSISEYKEYKISGNMPETFSGGDIFVSNQEMDALIKLMPFLDDKSYYTNITYPQPIREISLHFWNIIVDRMLELDANPDNIRMVFWFDN